MLLSGIAATVIAVLELLYYVIRTSRHRPGSGGVWSVFKEEIGNAVRCSGGSLHSPVVMVRQRADSHYDDAATAAADTIVETPSSIGCREGHRDISNGLPELSCESERAVIPYSNTIFYLKPCISLTSE